MSNFGVDFDQYFDVSNDFVLNTQIENSVDPPKSIFYSENLHTAV